MLSTNIDQSTTTSSSTAAATDAAVMPSDTAYTQARRSQRVGGDVVATDGDIWQEKLAVCEGSTDTGEPRLIIRSYYRNARTQERIWDEPPSGAGVVLHASPEMRSKAESQKQELQLLLEMIPPEEEELEAGSGSERRSKSKKKGLFGRFARKKKEKKHVDASRDLNLQRAIARSMADQMGGSGGDDDPMIYYDDGEPSGIMQGHVSGSHSKYQDDDEDLELAKALSMSVETAQREACGGNVNLTEEEMFQRALERSREESMRQGANGVASLPSWLHDSSTSISASPQVSVKKGVKSDPNDDYDDDLANQNLPAAPALSRKDPPPGLSSMKQFDPYG